MCEDGGVVLVCLAQAGEDDVDALADVGLVLEGDDVLKVAALGYSYEQAGAGVILVADKFQEEDHEHVVLVLRGVHAAAQVVAALPERAIELAFLDGHKSYCPDITNLQIRHNTAAGPANKFMLLR